jgi:hypothetical protein
MQVPMPMPTSVRTHVEHSISFVKDQVVDLGQRHARPRDEVDEATGRGNQDVAPLVQIKHLLFNVMPTIHHHAADGRLEGKPA